MDFWELAKVLLRRWAVFLPLVLLTAGAAWGATTQVPPRFSASASVILLPPTGGEGANAYLSLGIPTTAESLAVATTDDRVREQLLAGGASPDFEVVADRRSALLLVTAEAGTRAGAVSTVEDLLEVLAQRLDRQQDDVSAAQDTRITLQSLTPTVLAVPVTEGTTRVVVVVVAVGLALATAAALAVEGLARRRQRRPSRHVEPLDDELLVASPPRRTADLRS